MTKWQNRTRGAAQLQSGAHATRRPPYRPAMVCLSSWHWTIWAGWSRLSIGLLSQPTPPNNKPKKHLFRGAPKHGADPEGPRNAHKVDCRTLGPREPVFPWLRVWGERKRVAEEAVPIAQLGFLAKSCPPRQAALCKRASGGPLVAEKVGKWLEDGWKPTGCVQCWFVWMWNNQEKEEEQERAS